ncbi:Ldh family oxidoreductase [Rubellimicrobium rubrum]|uniref:Ldh family oxidoreductase n=1 Tax=Rubellimicrobium rubrum TaxID=2585369 RepID=A0A5C4MSN6_9RHOB|nr:Ldh family oxidoreductase [Rubellimicrobium rubrum]TNC47500.1 Ldh family oxidoreductase [Rubellimicrobium rubrum]
MIVPEQNLRLLAGDLLAHHGVPPEAAALQASVLVEAELRGLPSHGLQRLPRLLARLGTGLAHPAAMGRQEWRRPGLLTVDGERGLGPVVMMAALDALLARVAETGIAMAAIRNANHIGMLAYYAEQAVDRGLAGIVMCTSEALVHPFGGTRAMLGTNPIAIGIPTGTDPFVLDLATSQVSMGRIHSHALLGEPLEDGWAVAADGHPTTDAEAAKSGALAPFGGAKGYGLGLAVELLVALLAGSDLAPEVRGTLDDTHVANKGDILLLIDPRGGAADRCGLSEYLHALRTSRPADPERPVAIPGDGMRARRAAALRDGVDVPDALMDQLNRVRAVVA